MGSFGCEGAKRLNINSIILLQLMLMTLHNIMPSVQANWKRFFPDILYKGNYRGILGHCGCIGQGQTVMARTFPALFSSRGEGTKLQRYLNYMKATNEQVWGGSNLTSSPCWRSNLIQLLQIQSKPKKTIAESRVTQPMTTQTLDTLYFDGWMHLGLKLERGDLKLG